jgi:AcrR family transcriptional regulator
MPAESTRAKLTGMETNSGTGLPANVAGAWGVQERPTKGPKPGLSLERIVDAAVAVAASEGLAAVSMGRVAKELGTGPMSLYRYVSAKNELLALMEDAALGSPPSPQSETGWRAGLSDWAWAMRAAIGRNLWALAIPVTSPPILPNMVAWMEVGLRHLRETGLDEGRKISTIMLISNYVKGEAASMAGVAAAFQASGASTPDAWMSTYARSLAKLADPRLFPALHASLDAGAMDKADGPDDEFTFGLERLLDGLDVLITRLP